MYKEFVKKSKELNIKRNTKDMFRYLCAFWWHFSLYERKSDYSGKKIISVFDEDCPYPVWHKDEWIKNANPPSSEFDFSKSLFDNLWDLFQRCPIPHNSGYKNENCEYTDDFWYSKDCFLCHSAYKCENMQYCYRAIEMLNSQFCVYSFKSENCIDIVNCNSCYNLVYAIDAENCRDSYFLFDCRNCNNCFCCWNLRNKKYCILNKQYSKEGYKEKLKNIDLSSRKTYDKVKDKFHNFLKTRAWWKPLEHIEVINSTGNILQYTKDCKNCFCLQNSEDCVNSMRGYGNKDLIDSLSVLNSEQVFHTYQLTDCYDISFSINLIQCKFMEYCGHCYNCENCFGCCGLVNKKYCILNKQYNPEEYKHLVIKIRDKIYKDGDFGKFFPFYFAANGFDDSLASVYWPLSENEQKKLGFRVKVQEKRDKANTYDVSDIPDKPTDADKSISDKIFWDERYNKPFKITKYDIGFAKKHKVPLSNCSYVNRLRENFSWVFFDGEIRETKSAISGKRIYTGLPKFLDSRILSIDEYNEKIGY